MTDSSIFTCKVRQRNIAWSPFVLVLLLLCMISCKGDKTKESRITNDKRQVFFGNAIYHWKNTFYLTDEELKFLKKHDVKRIYVRLFDVVDERREGYRAVPSATVKFQGEIPECVEFVPTVFITNEAMESIDSTGLYSELICKRIIAMAKANKLGTIREVQLDCDWNESTQKAYFSLCEKMRMSLKHDSIILSSTIRLHQLKKQAPPVDCGALMLYNTANVKEISTKNSILSYEDVEPYLKGSISYALPLSFSYPAFGWDVLFKDERFERLCNIPDFLISDTTYFALEHDVIDMYVAKKSIPQLQINVHDKVRRERASMSDILKVKALVEKQIRQDRYPSIMYHLDNEQLSHIQESQIDSIYE